MIKCCVKLGFSKIQEAAWWQQYNVEDLDVTFLPAKHWNRRFIADYNTTLWGTLYKNVCQNYFILLEI
ncbi:MAG: hypothetical protein IPF58_05790 [Saprospirales bacterium]|nr:hypothetical protein [Saprospirales bacterium]